MKSIHLFCAGIDVHQRTIVICALYRDAQGQSHCDLMTFPTTQGDLLRARAWLQQRGITHVAMESTGVYWKPVYEVFEGHFQLSVVNPRFVKGLIGRKTDRADATWIAELHQQDLLPASFIPSAAQRQLRDLTRSRTRLMQERARFIQRIQKVLEQAHLKLASVVSDVLGMSSRAILDQLLQGESDPKALAKLARGRLRSKKDQLEQALVGQLQEHHRLQLREFLQQIDALDESIGRLNQAISQACAPHEELLTRLQSIPGVGLRLAEILLAEIGHDLSTFPTAKHLASWAGMCPGNHESAGKRLSGRIRPANVWLRSALTEAAQAAARSKDTFLSAQYHRQCRRLGKKKAIIALGHTLLIIIYHLITEQSEYRELGSQYIDERDREQVQRRLVRRLEQMGYGVTLTPDRTPIV